jgi:lysophospholipase L1-like esterase
MRNSILLLAFILIACSSSAQEKNQQEELEHPQDTVINFEKSVLFFPGGRDAQDRFYLQIDSLKADSLSNLNIWHVGASHVQGGIFPGKLRENFQELAGEGERGFVFPRQLAGTHEDRSIRMTAKGKWFAPMLTKNSKGKKPRYGITGFAARCYSTASIGLNTNPKKRKTHWSFKQIRLLGYASSEKAYPELYVENKQCKHEFDSLTATYFYDLPKATDSVRIDFVIPEGEYFVFTGLQPITGRKGINYFASGVNGASVTTWSDRCADLERELQLVKPDLVIFGLGINDSACDSLSFSPDRFKNGYRRLIQKVKNVSPDCAMIFITNNDSYRYVKGGMEYNYNADEVRTAMIELATEFNAGVWDLYGVMGERDSVHKWRKVGYISKDKLHFTPKGYRRIADLLFDAILADWKNTEED